MNKSEIFKRPQSHHYQKITVDGFTDLGITAATKGVGCMDGRLKQFELINPDVKRPIYGGEARWGGGSPGVVGGLLGIDKKLEVEQAVKIVNEQTKQEGNKFTAHKHCGHVQTALNGGHDVPTGKVNRMISHLKDGKIKIKKDKYEGDHTEKAIVNVFSRANTVTPLNPDDQFFRQDITRRNDHLTEVAKKAQSLGSPITPEKLINKVDEQVMKTFRALVKKETPIYNIYLDRPVPVVESGGFIAPRH